MFLLDFKYVPKEWPSMWREVSAFFQDVKNYVKMKFGWIFIWNGMVDEDVNRMSRLLKSIILLKSGNQTSTLKGFKIYISDLWFIWWWPISTFELKKDVFGWFLSWLQTMCEVFQKSVRCWFVCFLLWQSRRRQSSTFTQLSIGICRGNSVLWSSVIHRLSMWRKVTRKNKPLICFMISIYDGFL